MISLAFRLLLRKIDRTAITIMILVPVVAILVGSNLLIGAYATETQSVVGSLQPGGDYIAYGIPGSLSYSTYLTINRSDVSWAVPYLEIPAVTIGGTNTSIVGTNINALIAAKHSQLLGKIATDEYQADAGAILSKLLVLSIGENVSVQTSSFSHTFKIVGIINSSGPTDAQLLIPLSSAWSIEPNENQSLSFVEFSTSHQIAPPQGVRITDATGLRQVAKTLGSDTVSLISTWTYVLLFLIAVVGVAASQRVLSGSAAEYEVLRIIGASLSQARRLLLYEFTLVAAASVIIGCSLGIAIVEVLLTFLQALFHTPVIVGISLVQLLILCGTSFVLIFLVGSLIALRVAEPKWY